MTALVFPAASPVRGIALMMSAFFMFVAMDAVAKYLTATLPLMQIVWARNVFALVFALALARGRAPLAMVAQSRPVLQLARSGLLFLSTLFFFGAIKYIPLADATSIGFVTPLLVVVLAIPFLGEKVGIRRWAAVFVGMAGALIVIRPGFGTMQTAALLPLGSALCFSLYQIATRVLAASDPPMVTMIYSPVVGAVIATAFLPWMWEWPDAQGWVLLVLIGVIGCVGHLLMIQAYTFAPASLLSPFAYTQLVWSVAFGYAVFGDLPDRYTVLGAAIIAGSGLYTLYRESLKRKTAA